MSESVSGALYTAEFNNPNRVNICDLIIVAANYIYLEQHMWLVIIKINLITKM